jgi:hypothetical protein
VLYQGAVVAQPNPIAPTQLVWSAAVPSTATLNLGNFAPGNYDLAVRFRNGLVTNTLPLTVSAPGPTCTDLTRNGAETDVDCGGGTCPRCVNGLACGAPGDCVSNSCVGNVCTAPAPTCFSEVNFQATTGSGTCADPYIIDLSAFGPFSISSHSAAGGADEADMAIGPCGAGPIGTARDVVYQLILPASGVSLVEATVEAGAGDARVSILEDSSCTQPNNACANAGGAGACEVVSAPRGSLGTSPRVVVSEVTSSGSPLVMQFRYR